MTRVLVGLGLLCIACCVGCADPSRDVMDAGGTGVDGDGTGDAGDGDEGEIRLDVEDGMGSADDGGDAEGCRGIDFLFVVDNSGSMQGEQQNLVSSFPGFVDTMQAKVAELEAGDFHIMIVDSDEVYINNPGPYCSLSCESPTDMCPADGGSSMVSCAFALEPGCMATCAGDLEGSCDAGTCKDLLGCDACGCTLGGGRLDDLDGNPCNVAGGKRYIQDGQPDLHGTFACLAEVGTEGDGDERMAGAMVDALAPQALAGGGCNEGFVRDDAILVVTLITDEDDAIDGEGSPGDPPDWYDAVVAAKNGDPEAVVMLGLYGDIGQPNPICEDGGDVTGLFAERLDELVTSFPRHVVGSVCAPSYNDFFAQAVELIKDTCESYMPPEG